MVLFEDRASDNGIERYDGAKENHGVAMTNNSDLTYVRRQCVDVFKWAAAWFRQVPTQGQDDVGCSSIEIVARKGATCGCTIENCNDVSRNVTKDSIGEFSWTAGKNTGAGQQSTSGNPQPIAGIAGSDGKNPADSNTGQADEGPNGAALSKSVRTSSSAICLCSLTVLLLVHMHEKLYW
ncbi:hypothetical protein RvY_15095 [Ramazzottius varieornatus]|uniref:Uncharacterized protein n=1 Tax=Ramazzottius varieornatus TaxID=947166 RepID=A0A1D1VYI9_RAMVA|nr:hypothetical protein RvY_15095 [Ramazzottius varieornatus]